MGQSAIMAAIAAKDHEAIRAAMVGELVPVIDADTDPQTWDPRELGASGGNVFPAVIWQEKIWYRDPDDATTDHDEITCIVTLDGSRYKTNDVRVPESVLSYSVTTPPDPDDIDPDLRPDYGDGYLVPAAATDEWADHDNDTATWTARGWAYVAARPGMLVYVEDETGFYHYTAAGAWEAGLGSYSLSAGTVRPSALLIRSWAFENATTTAPPANGPAGESYIIGPSATGPWAGQDGKIAWRPTLNAAFIVTTPFVGEEGYNKGLANRVKWNGSAWVSAAGAWIAFTSVSRATAGGSSDGGAASYSYDAATPPIITVAGCKDTATILTHQAKKAGSKLRFIWAGDFSGTANKELTAAIFRDAEANAIAWRRAWTDSTNGFIPNHYEFLLTAVDALSHDYFFRVMLPVAAFFGTFGPRHFSVEEGG